MGGSVGVVVRKPNGEVVPMCRWTNIMPYHLMDVDLHSNNFDEWYTKFTKSWLEMKEDYIKNKDTGKFEHNMTDVYFPHDNMIPVEYGIIVFDFLKKTIYSAQEYCSEQNFPLYHLMLDHTRKPEDSYLGDIIKLHKKGYFKTMIVNIYDKEHNIKEKINLDVGSLETDNFISILKEILGSSKTRFSEASKAYEHPLLKKYDLSNVDINHCDLPVESGWKYFVPDSINSNYNLLLVKQEMQNNGFIFSDEDNKLWKEYFSYSEIYVDEASEPSIKTFLELYYEIFGEEFALITDD